MISPQDVVITGIGVVCPVGIGFEGYWASLSAGRSGVTVIEPFHHERMPFHIGAPILNFDGKEFIQPRKVLKVMSREIQTACAAADLALKHAGLAKGTMEPERFGIVLGSEMLYGEIDELQDAYRHCVTEQGFQFDRWGKSFPTDIFPLWMLKYLPNMAACHVGIIHDARGPNNTITLGEVSSLLALMEGANYIRRGAADVVLVGGSGSRLSVAALPFRGAHDVSSSDGDPTKVSRPFDLHRTGMVQGEGAGMIVLERREHAERRGARIFARVAGYASRHEAAMNQERTGSSIRHAITAALRTSNLEPREIGHVNAHGLSTPLDDRLEAQAIHSLLGDVPVTALKSYFGYLGAGGGMVELAGSLGAFLNNQVPATLNYITPDPHCPVRVVREPLSPALGTALVLNHNPTGQAAAVVLSSEC